MFGPVFLGEVILKINRILNFAPRARVFPDEKGNRPINRRGYTSSRRGRKRESSGRDFNGAKIARKLVTFLVIDL
jgi:hypothetical protein